MKRFVFAFLSVGLLYNSARADFLFSTQESFTSGANTFNKFDIISTNGSGSYTKVITTLSAILPPETGIDALQSISPNTTVFSLREDATVQGTLFHKQDLMVWNGTTATLLWNGISNGLPAEVNLDAIDITNLSPLTFSFSVGEGTNLTGVGQVSRNDAIHFVQGTGFTGKDFDAAANNVPAELNLDSFNIVSGTQRVMSFDATGNLPSGSGNLFSKADLVSFNPTGPGFSATPYFNAKANGIPSEVNIDAADVTILTEIEEWYLMK